MFFASRYMLNLHLLAIGFNTLLMLAILWKQRSLAHRFERLTWHMDKDPRPTQETYESYDGPATIPMGQFPRKWEHKD